MRKRLLAPCATYSPPDAAPTVDMSRFVLNLVLFDKFILHSDGLKEFPQLVRTFGYGPIQETLSSGAVEIYVPSLTVAEVGQIPLGTRAQKGVLPPGSYSFSIIRGADRQRDVSHYLQQIHGLTQLGPRQINALKKVLVPRLLPPLDVPATSEIVQQLNNDLRVNVPNIKTAVALSLSDELRANVPPTAFSLTLNAIDDEDFRAESNISETFGLATERTHQVVTRGLLAIGGLNQRIAEMKAYNAMTGFRDTELPIFEQKLGFISGALSSEAQAGRMQRVLTIKGFEDLGECISRGEVDLIKVLEIRETRECREFRDWLWGLDSLSDTEIEERINSLRDRLSWFATSEGGKTVRWLASTGIGMASGAGVLGPIGGYLDTFLVEKVLPQPGPLSFLSNVYPSIFKGNDISTYSRGFGGP